MKKIISLFLGVLLMGMTATAQDYFEGKIKFDVSMDGENAEMFAAFMPEEFNYLIGKNDIKFSMKGGMMESMMGEWLINNESGVAYMLQHSSKTAYKIDPETADTEEADMTPEIIKTDEKMDIAGYECRKYEVKIDAPTGSITQEIWATDKIKVKRPAVEANGNVGQVFVEGLDAFPLKIVSDMPMGMGKMIISCSDVSPGKVEEMIFKLPADYKVEIFDPEKFGQEIMGNY